MPCSRSKSPSPVSAPQAGDNISIHVFLLCSRVKFRTLGTNICVFIYTHTKGIQRQQTTDHVLFINLKNLLGLACFDEHCPAPADSHGLLQFFKVLLPKRMTNSAHPFQGRSVFPPVPLYASIHLSTSNIIDILVLKQG